jgi:DNA-binding transcriptional regulator YhcF (GntR family)
MPSVRREKDDSLRITALLRQRIATGHYRIGDRLPTIQEINTDRLDIPTGTRYARDAYASLIADGMVEARVGRTGGHFLVSATPLPTHEHLAATADDIAALIYHAERLALRSLYVVDIRKSRSHRGIGECLQPNRGAAEEFATAVLNALGEPMPAIQRAVSEASHAGSRTRAGGYQLRIYGRRLGDSTKCGSEHHDSSPV